MAEGRNWSAWVPLQRSRPGADDAVVALTKDTVCQFLNPDGSISAAQSLPAGETQIYGKSAIRYLAPEPSKTLGAPTEAVEHGEDDIVRELLCEMCGRDYPVWSAPDDLWNEAMRLPDGSDGHDFVCPTCFTVAAAFAGVETSFRVERMHAKSPATEATGPRRQLAKHLQDTRGSRRRKDPTSRVNPDGEAGTGRSTSPPERLKTRSGEPSGPRKIGRAGKEIPDTGLTPEGSRKVAEREADV